MQVLLQAPTPFDQSILWRFHDAYFGARGIDAWNQGEVPFYSTSNYASARQHAGFLTDLVLSQLETGRLAEGQEIWILEVGSGLGRFAANFLRALEIACGPAGAEVFDRLRYVLSDYSERSLREACATRALEPHVKAGRVIPALFDLRSRPGEGGLHFLDGAKGPPNAAFASQFQMVIANYVCCVVPLKNLQHKQAEGWLEQWVRVESKVADDAAPKPAEQMIDEMLATPTREGMVKGLTIQWEWRSRPLEEVYPKALHRDVLAALVRGLGDATVGYPHGFIDFVEGAGELLAPGGVMLVNDYGSIERKELAGLSERKPQIYGNSLANSINYAVFDAFAEVTGWHLLRSRDKLGSLHTAALRPGIGWTEREDLGFRKNYIAWRGGDDILDFTHTARLCAEKKDYDRALRYWRRAIELEPENPDHHYRAGDAAIDLGQYEMAVTFLEEGRGLAAGDTTLDFEFQLGRATCLASDYPASIGWYEKALEKENHPTTWTNLGVLYESADRFQDAYRCFKTAMEVDPQYARGRERMQILKDLLWRRKIEEFEGAGAKDPLRKLEDKKSVKEEKTASGDDEEEPAEDEESDDAEDEESDEEESDEEESDDEEEEDDEDEEEEEEEEEESDDEDDEESDDEDDEESDDEDDEESDDDEKSAAA